MVVRRSGPVTRKRPSASTSSTWTAVAPQAGPAGGQGDRNFEAGQQVASVPAAALHEVLDGVVVRGGRLGGQTPLGRRRQRP